MSSPGLLRSWKEISAYVGTTKRTLQRWEQRFGFPVHRPSGKSRSAVVALPDEIRDWTRTTPCLLRTKGDETGFFLVQPKLERALIRGSRKCLSPTRAGRPPSVLENKRGHCSPAVLRNGRTCLDSSQLCVATERLSVTAKELRARSQQLRKDLKQARAEQRTLRDQLLLLMKEQAEHWIELSDNWNIC